MLRHFNKFLSILILTGSILAIVACSTAQKPGATPASSSKATATVIVPVRSGGLSIAEAEVVPLSHASISFSIPGIVEEVLVPEGATVKKGIAIARLKGREKAAAALSTAQAGLVSAQQAVDNLYKENDVARTNAELALADANKGLDDAKKELDRRNYKYTSSNALDAARANYYMAQDAVKTAEDNYKSVEFLSEDNVNRNYYLAQLAAARTARDRALWNLNYLLGLPNNLDVAQAQAKVQVAQAAVDDAQRKYNDVKNGPDPDSLALANANLDNATKQVGAAETALTDLELRAPIDGTVVNNDLKVGEFVNPGTSTIVLADLTDMQVETTDLTELTVVNISKGDPVTVTFDALPDIDLTGRVVKINSLGVNKQGDITYTVTVELDKQDPRLRWNMTASVSFNR
jgi:HlyD family secretion protein